MSFTARFAFMLIIAGAVGNFIDRIAHGHVIDFIDVWYGNYHWPAFNVADSCITIGGILMAYTLLRAKGEQKQ
jgi:signal peptidase II